MRALPVVQPDIEDECAILGWMLLHRHELHVVTDFMHVEDFRDPFAATLYADLRANGVDALKVIAERTPAIVTVEKLRATVDVAALSTDILRVKIARIMGLAMRWQAQRRAEETFVQAADPAISDEEFSAFVASWAMDLELPAHKSDEPVLTGRQFVAATDMAYDWIAPGMLERGDRVMISAKGGRGKSTLLRTWACQIASGVHPLTREPMDASRVLIVDLENSNRQIARKLQPILDGPCQGNDMTKLGVETHDGVIDITTPAGWRWLASAVERHEPDLLIVGPIYRMYSMEPMRGDAGGVGKVERAVGALDRLRSRYGCAIILESHPPDTENVLRPHGSAMWTWWPDVGLALDYYDGPNGIEQDVLRVMEFRPPRDERTFPLFLHQGRRPCNWPWIGTRSPAVPNGLYDPMEPEYDREWDD